MIRRLLLLTSLVAFAFSAVADTDEAVQARKVALELAGAFSNDGFKIRDGHWSAPLKGGEEEKAADHYFASVLLWISPISLLTAPFSCCTSSWVGAPLFGKVTSF